MLVAIMISCFLSTLIFSYLFYWLNKSKFGLFKQIQSKIDTLNEKKKNKLKLITYIFVIIVLFFLLLNNINRIMIGVIAGIIISFRDIYFRNTFIDILKNDQ
ncbi:hypothetical protein ACQPUY_02475 [Clostridium nigeriense]|uniref:hypothetical protein n=1 Tax=Clostridium nigeriense TaxID=1805470 RepID=UPI003D342D1E